MSAMLVLAAPADARSDHLGDRTLVKGMSGNDVRELQSDLTKAGFTTPVVGVFGSVTDGNVRSFERKYHLRVNGIVDRTVAAKLEQVVAPKSNKKARTKRTTKAAPLFNRTLKQGMQGNDVKLLQQYLTRAGYWTAADGQFGPGTAQSVKSFESAHHLRADGVVSGTVSSALQAAVASRPRSVRSSVAFAKATLSNGLAVAPASAPIEVKRMIATANKIASTPYCYGGGHGSFSDSCYDCSGSVSYALHGGGRLTDPLDSTELESYGAPGGGTWVTIWANSGHTYMYIAGLRFDTGAQSSTGGSRWSTVGASHAGYVVRHPRGL
jgi:peptidoglycan hydrolase-like protein with peptidoglycan-binding domain